MATEAAAKVAAEAAPKVAAEAAPKVAAEAIGRFWLVGLVGQKMALAISNSFYVVPCPILAPIPNFIQIG